ncbi:endonuclease domain-containing protein [Sphingomonas sp. DT-207]|uniref:endonuclease domain-containing protein n=1 Tax=Sphingomonas sp. DT-207 TaxID=3396167 RepID=UPI003F1D5A5A
MLQGTPENNRRAKEARKELSLPEVLLWGALKTRPQGLKFRKQHPSGPYFADFYCHQARMIVEVDGDGHNFGDRPRRDAIRDNWFQARGLDVLRVPAREVLRDLDGVVRGIVDRAAQRFRDQE